MYECRDNLQTFETLLLQMTRLKEKKINEIMPVNELEKLAQINDEQLTIVLEKIWIQEWSNGVWIDNL